MPKNDDLERTRDDRSLKAYVHPGWLYILVLSFPSGLLHYLELNYLLFGQALFHNICALLLPHEWIQNGHIQLYLQTPLVRYSYIIDTIDIKDPCLYYCWFHILFQEHKQEHCLDSALLAFGILVRQNHDESGHQSNCKYHSKMNIFLKNSFDSCK